MNKDLIKSRQRFVLCHPCRTLTECGQPGMVIDWQMGGIKLRTVLTIDLFTEPLAWHADVAVLNSDDTAIPVIRWTPADRAAALDFAKRMLEGVGVKDQLKLDGDAWRLGFIRPLTIQEASFVLGMAERRARPAPIPIGELNAYDTNDERTRADEHSWAPVERKIIYAGN